MTVTDPCVSLATGTLQPDRRVNYTFGMVLGLAEFLQEQHHRLTWNYRHAATLHDFGTVHGLSVTATEVPGAADFRIGVAAGMALDQLGRDAVVRSEQCAHLAAWLGAQERAKAGTIAANTDPAGQLTAYVTLKYAECPDELVPIPGQACGGDTQATAAARIRDSWDICLDWQPPPMPRWDTDRRLARLLNSVQVVAGLADADSDEAAIMDAIRTLPADAAAGPGNLWPLVNWPADNPRPLPPVWRLPAERADEALDRILTLWVTQVRPQLAPDLIAPPADFDPRILLATIRFTLSAGVVGEADPQVATCSEPDDTGRPYLLHTRLIQLLRINGPAGAPPVVDAPQARQLATITGKVDDAGQLVLTAWFHLGRPVGLTDLLTVVSRSGSKGAFKGTPIGAVDADGRSEVWELRFEPGGEAETFPIADGEQVAVLFDPPSVLVGDPGATLATLITAGLDLLDVARGGEVVVYGTVTGPAARPPEVPPAEPQRPVLEFVTITSVRAEPANAFTFELWFHPQPQFPLLRATVTEFEPDMVELFEERSRSRVQPLNTRQVVGNVWRAQFERNFEGNGYLRFVFDATRIVVSISADENPDGPADRMLLVEWMDKARFTFQDWDPEQLRISAYLRIGSAQ